jgi:hypothetical protein
MRSLSSGSNVKRWRSDFGVVLPAAAGTIA